MTEHRLEVADVFRQHAREFFARWGCTLSAHQRKAFRDICACRTAALGARFEQCDYCSHQNIQFHSCRNRHCPKCQSTARDRWLDRTAKELLPVPYSHVIFTLPGALASLVRQNTKLIYNLLFRCVSETLLAIAGDPSRLGADLGFLAVLHTWNQKMMTHPHLHCLVPAGGLSPDRSRWVHSRKRFFLPGPVLGRMFRGKFLALLAVAFRHKKLRLVGELQPLQRAGAFDRFLHSLRKPEWVVEVRAPFGGPEHVLKYLARYTHRVAISNGRLIELRDGRVTFRWRDSADHNTQKLMTIEAVEFIRRFLLHVLPSGFVKIRHFGFLANGRRADGLKLCRALLRASPAAGPVDHSTAQRDRTQMSLLWYRNPLPPGIRSSWRAERRGDSSLRSAGLIMRRYQLRLTKCRPRSRSAEWQLRCVRSGREPRQKLLFLGPHGLPQDLNALTQSFSSTRALDARTTKAHQSP